MALWISTDNNFSVTTKRYHRKRGVTGDEGPFCGASTHAQAGMAKSLAESF